MSKPQTLADLGIDMNPNAVHWIVEYDLPAETRDVDEKTKMMLNSLRTQVWRMLRMKYKCHRLADSSWLIRNAQDLLIGDVTVIDALQADLKKFRQRYAKSGFEPNIIVTPIASTPDYSLYVRKTVMHGLWDEVKKLDKRIDEYLAKKKVKQRIFEEMRETLKLQIDIFTEDYGTTHQDYWRFEKEYMRVMDKLMGSPGKQGLRAFAVAGE